MIPRTRTRALAHTDGAGAGRHRGQRVRVARAVHRVLHDGPGLERAVRAAADQCATRRTQPPAAAAAHRADTDRDPRAAGHAVRHVRRVQALVREARGGGPQAVYGGGEPSVCEFD